MVRLILFVFVIAICLAVAPVGRPTVQTFIATPLPVPTILTCDALPSNEQFAILARTDPIAMMQASLSRYSCEIRGYTCTMQKQERLGGKLGLEEVIRVAFRDDPFAVLMKWERGAGLATATLYARGENNGKMKVRSFIGLNTDTDPTGRMARQSSRFAITDSGIYRGTLRSHRVWSASRDRGELKVAFAGTKTVLACGNRLCHVIVRTCDNPEIDNFSLDEPDLRKVTDFPLEALGKVTLMYDAETWLQVGTEIQRPDGSLLATYYFRDIVLNPTFDPQQFHPSALSKK